MNVFDAINPRDVESYSHNPYPKGFTKSIVPAGQSGDWAVQKFSVTADQVGLGNLRALRDGNPRRVIPPGDYTRLVHAGEGVVMSDTPAEAWEHVALLYGARGRVLLNGLGLGFALQAILAKPEVEQVTIIEKSADVIALTGPSFARDSRVGIVHADAFEWRPPKGTRLDYVWHDVWTRASEDNLEEITRLKRSYGRRADAQGAWSEEYPPAQVRTKPDGSRGPPGPAVKPPLTSPSDKEKP